MTNVPEPNLNLAILIGLLLTDGSISKSKNSWDIEFTNKSKELHSIFRKVLRELFGEIHFQEGSDSRNGDIVRTRVKSKHIGDFLHKFSPTFRTKKFKNGEFPLSRLPDFVFQLKVQEIKEFLKILFSTDGCVVLSICWERKRKCWRIKPQVKITCAHPLIRKQIFDLLHNLGFSPIIHSKNFDIMLNKKSDLIKFAKEIRFVDGVKVTKNSKNWRGFEKNQILDLAIKTFELRKKDLEKFKTKEEVIDFLKSFLRAPAPDCKRPRVQVPTG